MVPRETALTFDQLKTSLSARARMFFIDATPRVVLCSLDSDHSAVIKAILLQCAEDDLGFEFFKGGKFHEPQSVREAWTVMRGGRLLRFRLVDLRRSETFEFDLQIWQEFSDYIEAPKKNLLSRKVWRRSLDAVPMPQIGRVSHLRDILGGAPDTVARFDIDYVYTWVNSEDPEWKEMYAEYRPESKTDSNSLSRFYSRDELMFSLRSLAMYAPWVRRIHIVSNCKPPPWLDIAHPRINWVPHEQIFDLADLPTFSSHAIEARLHKIEGLSNHFIYSNDDFLLTRPSKKTDFFEPNGICKLKLERWGNVNGDPKEDEPDYLNGARNCQRLIERDYGVSPTQLHCHAPQALRVDVLNEMEAKYGEKFKRTSRARFRSMHDVAVTGFFFHHYVLATGRGIKGNQKTMLIQQNHQFEPLLKKILAERSTPDDERRHLSICLNDGADSHLNENWNRSILRFLNQYFSERSDFERR